MLDVVVFEDSDELAEFGGVSVFSVAEWKHRKTQKLHRTQQAHLDPQRQQHQALTTAQVMDVISASKKNS